VACDHRLNPRPRCIPEQLPHFRAAGGNPATPQSASTLLLRNCYGKGPTDSYRTNTRSDGASDREAATRDTLWRKSPRQCCAVVGRGRTGGYRTAVRGVPAGSPRDSRVMAYSCTSSTSCLGPARSSGCHSVRTTRPERGGRRAQEDAQRSTLKQLLDTYIAYLDRRGKQSARDAKSIFGRHVLEAAPDLAIRKATDVSVDEFVGLIAKLSEAGKGRTAAKCRSYLRAAYSLAIRSRADPSAPLAMRSFGITANPIASIGALSQFSRARDRVLSGPEFAAFLKRVEALPEGTPRDTLQLAVLLGGQRPQQLLRARAADVDLSAGTITLSDPKGARQQPRRHVLPDTRRKRFPAYGKPWRRVSGSSLSNTRSSLPRRSTTIASSLTA
jgi:hypothetical protein